MYLFSTLWSTINMAELLETLLGLLSDTNTFDTLDLIDKLNTEHDKIVGGVKSLQSRGDVSSCVVAIHKSIESYAGRVCATDVIVDGIALLTLTLHLLHRNKMRCQNCKLKYNTITR